EISLGGEAPHLAQQVPGRFVLDALGDEIQPEATRELDRRPDNGGTTGIRREPADERAVDLDLLDGEPLEIGEGGVAGPEVVDGKAESLLPEPVHGFEYPTGFGHDRVLGDLQLQRQGVRVRS